MWGHQAGDFLPTERSLPSPASPLAALGNFEIALEPDPLCWLPRRTGEGGAMWKQPLPDFNLSSATLGLRSPFLCQVGSAPDTAHTPCSLNILRSGAQRQPARRCRGGHGPGTLGGLGAKLRCAAGKFGSVFEDSVVHSHETSFLALDFCPGVCGAQGETLASAPW